jgi:hypothetical protein
LPILSFFSKGFLNRSIITLLLLLARFRITRNE